jgi:hypothetical protein
MIGTLLSYSCLSLEMIAPTHEEEIEIELEIQRERQTERQTQGENVKIQQKQFVSLKK